MGIIHCPSPRATVKSQLFELGQKDKAYYTDRGWSEDLINSTIKNPMMKGSSINAILKNPATAYFLNKNQYIVIDDITKQLVQASDLKDPNWAVDSRIIKHGSQP